MLVNKLFGGTLATTTKALDLRMERQGLLQSNIANMETPGYKEQDFSFAKVMESVATGQGELRRTNPNTSLSIRWRRARPAPFPPRTGRWTWTRRW